MNQENILVVDDDKEMVSRIGNILKNGGFNILSAYNGKEAISIVNQSEIHLIIIDINMPEVDGLTAIKRIREKNNCPIIIVSAMSNTIDKVQGLNVGADDYVTKPFIEEELVARVNSALRRYTIFGGIQKEKHNVIQYYDLKLNREQCSFLVRGQNVKLTSTEYKIVELLLRRPKRIFSVEEIFKYALQDCVYDEYLGKNPVFLQISRLRKKIEVNPRKPEYIQTVRGRGYKLEKK